MFQYNIQNTWHNIPFELDFIHTYDMIRYKFFSFLFFDTDDIVIMITD